MLDKNIKIDTANRQSFMAAEYIFRVMQVGDTFTSNFLLNNVGFKSPNARAQTGIRVALDLLTENRNGKKNVTIVSTNPNDEIVYKLIDNETPILIEKNKDQGVLSINSKYFETLSNSDFSYQPSQGTLEKISSLRTTVISTNDYAISTVEAKSDFDQKFEQQARDMTPAQRNKAMLILYRQTHEQLTDALSVLELAGNV